MEEWYRTLIDQIAALDRQKQLIIALLGMERMWHTFYEAAEEYRWDVRFDVRQCMDLLWNQALYTELTEHERSRFEELLEHMADHLEEDAEHEIEYPNSVRGNYLINIFFSNASWLLNGKQDSASSLFGILGAMNDLLTDAIVDKYSDVDDDVIAANQSVVYELACIRADIKLAADFPNTRERILSVREQYQGLDILSYV